MKKAIVETSMGTITLELNEEKAPITVANFVRARDVRPLRRHDLPPRHRRVHDPGRRLHEGDEPEADARADPHQNVPEKPVVITKVTVC